jgi:hypothetical protein
MMSKQVRSLPERLIDYVILPGIVICILAAAIILAPERPQRATPSPSSAPALSALETRITDLERENAGLKSQLDSEHAGAKRIPPSTPLAGDHVSRWLNLGAYRAYAGIEQ